MNSSEKNNHKTRRPYNAKHERLAWAGTILLIAALLIGTVYFTPDLRNNFWPNVTSKEVTSADAAETKTENTGISTQLEQPENNNHTSIQPESQMITPQDGSIAVDGKITEDKPGSSDSVQSILAPDVFGSLLSDNFSIIRNYGYGYNPNTDDYRFHRGYDITAAESEEVNAIIGGTVVEAWEDAYWGGVVILDHGSGWQTIYRCLIPTVTNGTVVKNGDMLGRVTLTAAESLQESHYHLELEQNGESIDPLSLI